MGKINSLNFLPKHTNNESGDVTNTVTKLIPSYCFLLCERFKEEYHKFHHTHRDIFFFSIRKKLSPIIMNVENPVER